MKRIQPNEDWVLIVLLSCLAVALTFLTFGLGLVNLAEAKTGSTIGASPPNQPPLSPETGAASAAERERQARQLSGEIAQLNQLAEQYQQEAARHREARKEAERRLEEARRRASTAEAQARELENLVRARTAALLAQRSEQQRANQQRMAAAAHLATLRRELEQAEQRIRDLRRRLQETDLLDPGQLCGGSCAGKNPQFAECDSTGVTLQPQGNRFTPEELSRNPELFRKALGHRRYVLFLVRPSGIAAFRAARSCIEGHGFEFGFEPVEERWRFRYQVRGEKL